MKLNKRDCETKIRLTPLGSDFQKVQMRIHGEHHELYLSHIMGRQFSSLLSALYCLYDEEDHSHYYFRRYDNEYKRDYPQNRADGKYSTRVKVHWSGESYTSATIILVRESNDITPMPIDQPDPISMYIRYSQRCCKQYTIDGRDLCYAVAKAYTEALKKYGFKGFVKSSAGHDPGDSVDVEELLFVKAYALGVLETRETKMAWQAPNGYDEAFASSFKKEMELLLFDM